MLTTLWLMSVASIVAMGAALVGRHAAAEGAARVELERARWVAVACERRAQAAIDDLLRGAISEDDAAQVWRTLGPRIVTSPLVAGCDLVLEAAGSRLDINSASSEMIVNLLRAIGIEDRATEMADALIDWRDPDDMPLPLGAERQWYEGLARITPRNGPLGDVAELHRARGFESIDELDTVVTTEPGRISLATASVPVLMSVPGLTREAAEELVARQLAGNPVSDLLAITSSISQTSIDALAARYPEAVSATTPDPDAWIVRARASRGWPRVGVLLDWRVIRVGRRCAVARTRSIL
jgi:general secretion pathway protein K